MRSLVCACAAMLLAATTCVATAQQKEGSTSLTQLITAVAAKSGKKFLLDPRVEGNVTLIGQEISAVSLAELATILQVHGFVLFEGGGYVRVVPDAGARVMPVPVITGNERRPDAEHVSRVIKVKTMPATSLVPLLRPLVPQNGHLVAVPCTNVLMVVDTFANVRRLESVVQSLDTGGESYQPEKCTAPREAAPAVNPARN